MAVNPELEVYINEAGEHRKVIDDALLTGDEPKRMVNGKLLLLDADQIANRQAEVAAELAAQPIREWDEEMRQKDMELMQNARLFEDLITWATANGFVIPVGSPVSAIIADRQTHRGKRPI